ncbi:MAG: toxin [Rikenellaceae bacterium]
MATKEEVKQFLSNFFVKLEIYDILFRDDRGKNAKVFEVLDIVPSARKKIIKEIKVEDYSEGPIVNTLNQMGDMWVFGKNIQGEEIYIKISMGISNCSTICISFHIAEHPMKYPYKK